MYCTSFDRLKYEQLRDSSYLGLYARYSGTVFDARRHGAITKLGSYYTEIDVE